MLTLPFEIRDARQNPAKIRRGGAIPAVLYGPKEPSVSIAIKEIEFKKVWEKAGESSVIVLKGPDQEHEALINDVDVHPVTGNPRHADFYVFEKGKKLKVKVTLEFTGVSPAVKDLGGALVKVVHDLEIEALPKDLPHKIQVDIAPLATFESQILAKDIPLPSGVSLAVNPDDVVAAVSKAVEEIIEETPMDISDIEVEKKGKKEEEGALGEAPVAAPTKEAKEEKAEKGKEKK